MKRFDISRRVNDALICYTHKVKEKLLQDELSALSKPALLLDIIFPSHCPISYLNRVTFILRFFSFNEYFDMEGGLGIVGLYIV